MSVALSPHDCATKQLYLGFGFRARDLGFRVEGFLEPENPKKPPKPLKGPEAPKSRINPRWDLMACVNTVGTLNRVDHEPCTQGFGVVKCSRSYSPQMLTTVTLSTLNSEP